MRQTLTYDFGGLYKNKNCAFPLRTPFYTEQLQWLLPTFNLYFQRSQERKPVRLLAISTRFSCRKVFAVAKVSTSVREIIHGFLSFYFKILSFLNFSITKWFCRVACFLYDIFIIKKLFYNVIQTSSEISPSLRLLLKVCV